MAGKIGIGAAGAALGVLHDFGKYSLEFQQYLRRMAVNQDTEEEPGRGKVDHSTAGAQTVWRSLKQKGTQEEIVGEILALCLASHHSGLIDCITPSAVDNLSRRMRKADMASHHDEAWANSEPPATERIKEALQDPELVAGIGAVLRRICKIDKDERLLRLKIGFLVRFLFSCLVDADHTNTADFAKPTAATLRHHGCYAEWPVLAEHLERGLRCFSGNGPIDGKRQTNPSVHADDLVLN
jgi:CRISPR-associated endonuclease/helicase Cas3